MNHIAQYLPSYDFVNQMPGALYISSLDSKFLMANREGMKWTGYKSLDAMVGQTYKDMHCRASECHEEFLNQDKIILQNNGYGKLFGLYCYNSNNWKVVYAEKYPLRNEKNDIIALVSYMSDMTHSNIVDINRFLSLTNQKKSLHFYEQKGFFVDNHTHQAPLSNRLSECLFFLIRGSSAKEIAESLKLSYRTVESYIEQLKLTWECTNKRELIQKAIHLGHMNRIPQSLLDSCKIIP